MWLMALGRKGSSGGRQNNIIIFFAEHIYNVIQLVEIVFLLGRLKLCPGKYIDGSAVDPGIPEIFHVFLPDIPGPLIGVVVPAVQNS